MIRLSFLLVGLAAAVCCDSPNGPQTSHLQGCKDLEELTQEDLNERFANLVNKRSPANITNGKVICGGYTPVIAYIANDGYLYDTIEIVCTEEWWHANGIWADDWFKTRKVCCVNVDKHEEGDECPALGVLTREDLNSRTGKRVFKSSPANITNGTVICGGDTPDIAYIANDERLSNANEIVCPEGQWYADRIWIGNMLRTTKVCCVNLDEPEEPKAFWSYTLGDITQPEFDLKRPGYEVRKANVSSDGNVSCSDPKQKLFFLDGDDKLRRADAIKCNDEFCRVDNRRVGPKEFAHVDVCCARRKLEGCKELGEITQTEYDNSADDDRTGYEVVTKANITDGVVTCSDSTQSIIFFVKRQGIRPADTLVCTDGQWIAKSKKYGTKKVKAIGVACLSRQPISVEEKREGCNEPREIILTPFDARAPDTKYTKANFNDGNVTCSDSTQSIVFRNGRRGLFPADVLMCADGQWSATFHNTKRNVKATEVGCLSGKP